MSGNPSVTKICASCGVAYKVHPHRTSSRFCGNKCRGLGIRRQKTMALIEQFCIPEPNSGCWLWLGCHHKTRRGYGTLAFRDGPNRKVILAHRLSWELHNQLSAEGMEVRHRCDNPWCVNPEHLETGTHRQNMFDAVFRCRIAKGSRLPQAKLDEFKVVDIKRRLALGEFRYKIAIDYGVGASTIDAIAWGRSWKHVYHCPEVDQADAGNVVAGG